jgi:hypothetical protein
MGVGKAVGDGPEGREGGGALFADGGPGGGDWQIGWEGTGGAGEEGSADGAAAVVEVGG